MATPIMIFGCTVTTENGVIIIRPEPEPLDVDFVVKPEKSRVRDGSKRDRACEVLREAFAGHSIVHRSVIVAAGTKHGIPSGTMADARKHMGIEIKDSHWIWPAK